MTPLVFPHTCVSDTLREAILGIFGSMALLGVLNHPEDSYPGVTTVFRAQGIEEKVRCFLKEHTSGTGLIHEKLSSFLKGQGGVPLVDPDCVPFIRSAVLKGSDESYAHPNEPDVWPYVFRSAAFLEMARDYDVKNREIDRDLESVFSREKKLFETLLGDDDIAELRRESDMALSQPVPPDLSADMNIEQRISAWASLYVHGDASERDAMDVFFLTTRKPVIDHLKEHVPELVHIGTMGPESLDRLNRGGDLSRVLKELTLFDANEKMSCFDTTMSNTAEGLELYVAYHVHPNDFFSRFTETKVVREMDKNRFRNTVIGFFQM